MARGKAVVAYNVRVIEVVEDCEESTDHKNISQYPREHKNHPLPLSPKPLSNSPLGLSKGPQSIT